MTNYKLICVLALVFLFNGLTAQIAVRNEPHHKVVLENEYVRLIDVHIAPHDTTLVHVHAAPSVIVFLAKTTIGTQLIGAQPVIADVVPGQTSYAAYDEKPITHRVWNQGSVLFHVMDIELVKKSPAADSCTAFQNNGSQMQWSQKLVRAYTLNLTAGNAIHLPPSSCAHLVIDFDGAVNAVGPGSIRSLRAGSFAFFPPRSNIEISAGNDKAQCVMLELK